MTKSKTKQPTLRAIHIDPLAGTVSEIAMPNDFAAVKRDWLRCDLAQCLHLGGGVDAWFDEDGTLVDWDTQGFVKLAPGDLTLAGQVLLTGVDQRRGEWADLPAHVTVDKVLAICEFVAPQDVEIPGSSITTFDADGTPHTEYLGPEVRTYDNQQ